MLLVAGGLLNAQTPSLPPPAGDSNFGPYNASFLAGGVGLSNPLASDAPLLAAGAPWSISGWLRADRSTDEPMIIAALGDTAADLCRCLLLQHGQLALRLGGSVLRATADLAPHSWHAVAATYDGRTARLYIDGSELASAEAMTRVATAVFRLAPESLADLTGEHHFGGSLASFLLHADALDAAAIGKLSVQRPDFNLVYFHQVGVGWPWQEKAWRGLQVPQPAWTLPHGKAPFSAPVRAPSLALSSPLQAEAPGRWLVGAWQMAAAPTVNAAPEKISSAQFSHDDWYIAIVPGTVLTTLIANGVYPDPDYGLDNLAIPESLNRQDYWYRSEFVAPAQLGGRCSA